MHRIDSIISFVLFLALGCASAERKEESKPRPDGGGWDDTSGDVDADGDADGDGDGDSDGDADAVECDEDNATELCGAVALCVDGYCCDYTCKGECDVCNLPGKEGTCTAIAEKKVCRESAGDCDVAESCDGQTGDCPDDEVEPSSKVCRPSTDACDLEETCDGSGPTCPVDRVRPSTRVCRVAVGVCDEPERCPGDAKECPEDVIKDEGTSCRPADDECDIAEECDGASGRCPTDVFAAAGTECGNGDDTICDNPDSCDGAGNCQNNYEPETTVCRAGPEDCDATEYCTGLGPDCPADVVEPNTTICRPAVGSCDIAETCNGTDATCPADHYQPRNTECREVDGGCDVPEVCDGDAGVCPDDTYRPPGYECRPYLPGCDIAAEVCDGGTSDCPADTLAGVDYDLETFDGGTLPSGWSVIDGDADGYDTDGNTWVWADTLPPSTGAGGYYVADSNACTCAMGESLVTEVYDVGRCANVSVEFDHHYYDSSTTDFGFLQVQRNGGNWITVQTYDTTDESHQTISNPLPAGTATLRLKFHYQATDDWWWKVDNVQVSGDIN